MKTLIKKIKSLRNNGLKPCNKSIGFLESCKTPQEALEKAPFDYLEWLLDALKIDYKKERADFWSKVDVIRDDYCSKRTVFGADYLSKYNVIKADYDSKCNTILADFQSKCDAIDDDYANSLRKLVPTSFFS